MTMNRREMIAASLAAGGIGGAILPAGAQDPKPIRGGRLIISSSVEPVHLNGAFTTQAGPPTAKIFDGLIEVGLDGKPAPGLAKSWTISPDGREIAFKLREGVKWHDGQSFTARDVVFSLGVWKKYHARGRSTFANVTADEPTDDLTVVFRLSKPSPIILFGLVATDSPVLARHTYPEEGDLAISPRNNAPIGTGPFRFLAWERGSHVALGRNPDYWDKGKPYLDQIIIRSLPDQASTTAALESGSIQVSSFIPLSNIARLRSNPNLTIIDDPRGSLYYVGALVFEFNLDRPQFRDRRLREAFAHSIDRDFIQKNLFFGFATPTETPVPPGLPDWHNPDVPRYPFDLVKAESILEGAGYKRDKDGIRLRLANDYAANSAVHLQVAQYLRSTLARIGVELQVRTQDFGQFVNRVYTRRDFDSIIYHATVGPDPAIGAQRFYWSKNFQPGVAFSNAANYSNPEVDRLLEEAAVEMDPERRKSLYDAFQRIVQTDVVRIPIMSPRYPVVARSNVRNYIASASGDAGNLAGAYLANT